VPQCTELQTDRLTGEQTDRQTDNMTMQVGKDTV